MTMEHIKIKHLVLFMLGLIYSAEIAVITFLFLHFEHRLIDILWKKIPVYTKDFTPLYLFLLLTAGVGILYKIQDRYGRVPENVKETIIRYRRHDTVGCYRILPNLLSSLLIIVLGASVGAQSALLGIIISLSVLQSDKVRYVRFHYEDFLSSSWKDRLKIMFNPKKFLEHQHKDNSFKYKSLLRCIMLANGILVFAILNSMTEHPDFIVKLHESVWGKINLIDYLELVMCGISIGMVYLLLTKIGNQIWQRWIPWPKIQLIIGALCIYAVYFINSNLLFSGKGNLHYPMEYALTATPWDMMFMAWIKTLLLIICLQTGWRGGDMFATMFIGFMQGYAIAALLPSIDYLFCINCVTASFIATVTRQKIVCLLFLCFFFPLEYLPITISVIIGWMIIPRFIKHLRQKIAGMAAQ